MLKINGTLAALAAFAIATTAHAADLRFGTDAAYPPYEYKLPDGRLAGLDIDIGNALCAAAKVKCVWVENSFDGMVAGLQSRKFDAINSALAATDARRAVMDFTAPLYPADIRLVAKKGSGLRPDAKWVVAEGADAAAMTRSIPIEKCLDDAMLVYSQNGERLRPQQGYPLRILLPGYEGNMSVKWLRRLKVTAEPVYSREETSKYTDLMADGSAREFTFYMEAKSIITRPSGGQRLSTPGFQEITGIAWSGHGKIKRVDVSVDEGKTWQEAQLQEPVLTRALTRFRFPWHWDGKSVVIQSRATDETSYVQPTLAELTAVRGENSFYHNNAIWPWRIAANGEISNAQV